MTPPARHQAAIDILAQILAGTPPEQALTRWARGARYAGAKDRAAIRDLVFDALRCQRSFAHLGGAMTGRGLVLGGLRAAGIDPTLMFTGAPHGPAPLSPGERAHQPGPMPDAVALDCPDWLLPLMQRSLGPQAAAILSAQRHRAPVFLRVNIARTTQRQAIAALRADGIETAPHALADTALEVMSNPRKVQTSAAYLSGLVELQDVASQAILRCLPDLSGLRVLDYCAGGGGKALAMAAAGAHVTAHDAKPQRMQDLPARAARAGTPVAMTQAADGLFDLVLTDVPCSGSGSWRRTPGGKWALTPARLDALTAVQDSILKQAALHVKPGGWLAYATCSLLDVENAHRKTAFLQEDHGFEEVTERRLTPLDGGDGFYITVLQNIRDTTSAANKTGRRRGPH
ncbi:MAG: RsmB/NOP family class I SAM-dependent RNA methyltransferase [Roseinatronobacter sp.]